MNGFTELNERLFYDAPRRTDIETHITLTAGAEAGSRVECQMGFVGEELCQFFGGQAKGATIEEDEEGGFGAHDFNFGYLAAQKLVHKVDVLNDVVFHGVEPFFAMGVGCDEAFVGKEIALCKARSHEEFEEFLAQRFIDHHGVGGGEASDIESLARCHESDADACGRFAGCGKGDVLQGGVRQIGVNFVRDDHYASFLADVGDATKFFF